MANEPLDPHALLSGLLSALDGSVVNPRCDECGTSIPRQNTICGPFLCSDCTLIARIDFEHRVRDFRSQERPDRRVHVVKLPEGMRRASLSNQEE